MTLSILANEGNWMIPVKLYPLLVEVVLLGACTEMIVSRIHAAQGLVLHPLEYDTLAFMFNAYRS